MKYLRFAIMPFLVLLSIISLFMGPLYTILFFILLDGTFILGDFFLPQDKKKPIYNKPWILNGLLYINLPLLLGLYCILGWYCSDIDLLGFGNWIQSNSTFNIMDHKKNMQFYHYIFVIISSGLLVAGAGTVVGHELVHRTKEKVSMWFGNWLIALSFDMAFAIDHVYGHHKDVCLKKDSATAVRGQSIYHFIFSSSLGQFITAYKIESKRNKSIFQTRLAISTIRSILIISIMYLIGGIYGLIIALSIALIAKVLLETVNYIEHYGLVREFGQPVCPRHSWNSNHILSGLILYNITRHSSPFISISYDYN